MTVISSSGRVSSSGVFLSGMFSASLRHNIPAFRSPRSVVNSSGTAAPSMSVKFSGSIGNSGNQPITVTLKMRATSSGAALKSSDPTPQTVIVNPGDLKPVSISQLVDQTDVPGSISAVVWLTDAVGNTLSGTSKESGVIGTIQAVSTPTLTGTFTLA